MKIINFFFAILLATSIQGYAQCWQVASAGTGFSVAIKNDGTMWAWGLNSNGQLGIGNTINQTVPVQVGSSNDWQTVSAGNDQVHAIKTDGTLWGWGYNGNGQLGTGGYGLFTSPIQIGTDNNWQKVSAGFGFSMAIKTDGTLWGWGNNFYGEVGVPGSILYLTPQQVGTDTWQMVSAGFGNQTLAIKTNGTLWVCGYNLFGQLGTGDNNNRNSLTQIGTAANWQTVEACYFFSYAIKTDGTLWSWGRNDFGQLGNGINTNSNIPVQEATLSADWASVSGGQGLCLAKKTNGTIWSWGYGPNGDNFVLTNTPVQAGTETNWSLVSINWNHTLAIKNGNTLWAWGDGNDNGEIGNGTTTTTYTAVQVSCNVILPVTWLHVRGEIRNQTIVITWATASETNTRHFEIEHSINGINYSKAGTRTAAGNSNLEKQYEFVHLLPVSGKNYYRIKQIDLDGRSSYSSIVVVQYPDTRATLHIVPNPVQSDALLYFREPGMKTIQLFSMNGALLHTGKSSGANSRYIIPMANRAPGVYLLQVISANGTNTYNIMKQ